MRVLLADDSPHAQRMGERILREEGFEVVTVTDGDTALIRLVDVDPDVVLADVLLPHKSGYEICDFVKQSPKHRHARVVLLAGLLEPVDEAEAARVKADAVLKKPLEASAVLATVKPLAAAAYADRADGGAAAQGARRPVRVAGSILGLSNLPVAPRLTPKPMPPESAALPKSVLERVPEKLAARVAAEPAAAAAAVEPPKAVAAPDPELVRAAVTVALDRAMPALIDEITSRVLESLRR